MKKAIGIIILGLLWCDVGFADVFVYDCKNDVSNPDPNTWIKYTINSKEKILVMEYKHPDNPDVKRESSESNIIVILEFDNKFIKFTYRDYPEIFQFNYGQDSFIEANSKNDKALRIHCKLVSKPKKKKPKPDDEVVAASSGTGFFVSITGHIVTNHHVIEECKTVKVSFKGDEIEAKTLAIDKMNDLAIIKANITPSKVYSVSNEDASLLEDIIIAGYPLGKKVSSAIKTSKGSVTALAGYGDNYSEFQTDAALNRGNSGGPIMNQKGNVIGVAVAAYGKKEGVESFNFGIKVSTLKTFASSNDLTFLPPNNRDLSNKTLGKLITEGTVYLECWMTVAKIKQMIAEANNRKAFFSEYQ